MHESVSAEGGGWSSLVISFDLIGSPFRLSANSLRSAKLWSPKATAILTSGSFTRTVSVEESESILI